jgi:hypothetical protein
MWEWRSKRTRSEDTFRVDYLLECLRSVSNNDPSPALRERLRDLSSQRLQEKFASTKKPQDGLHMSLIWLRPMLAPILLITIGLVGTCTARQRITMQEAMLLEPRPAIKLTRCRSIRYQNRHYQNLVTHHLNRCATLGPDE